MSGSASDEPLLHFFEPNELADLREAFSFDKELERNYMKGISRSFDDEY